MAATTTTSCRNDDPPRHDAAPATRRAPADDRRRRPTTTRPGRRHDCTSDDTTAPADGGDKVTDFAAYIGGSGAADASLAPIKIGYFNQQGGAVVVSDTNVTGINAAVKFINEQAGGIGGHPLEVVTCYIANTEEEGQQCGQQFANDDDDRRDRSPARRSSGPSRSTLR